MHDLENQKPAEPNNKDSTETNGFKKNELITKKEKLKVITQ